MKIFFNIQSNELKKDSSIISLGMLSEDDKSLYAEFSDIQYNSLTEFIKNNVIESTLNLTIKNKISNTYNFQNKYPNTKKLFGTKEKLKPIILKWINQFDSIELISDVGHYNLVFLIDILFGNAIESNITTYYDVNQLISDTYNISTKEAFNISRAEIIGKPDEDNLKWNALVKADKISQVYNILLNKKEQKKNGKRKK